MNSTVFALKPDGTSRAANGLGQPGTYQVLGGFGSAIWTHGSGLGQDVRPIKLNGLDLGLGMTQPTKPRNPVKNGKAVCNASQ